MRYESMLVSSQSTGSSITAAPTPSCTMPDRMAVRPAGVGGRRAQGAQERRQRLKELPSQQGAGHGVNCHGAGTHAPAGGQAREHETHRRPCCGPRRRVGRPQTGRQSCCHACCSRGCAWRDRWARQACRAKGQGDFSRQDCQCTLQSDQCMHSCRSTTWNKQSSTHQVRIWVRYEDSVSLEGVNAPPRGRSYCRVW